MGLLKFRFPNSDPKHAERLKRAYVVGPDRSPSPLQAEVKDDLLICKRDSTESGRLHVPWPVEGFGVPVISTSTLAERLEPHHLVLELARGRLCDIRDQIADWTQLGLRLTDDLDKDLKNAQHCFAIAATGRDRLKEMNEAAQASLVATFSAGHRLIEQYVAQVMQTRLSGTQGRLSTYLACFAETDPKGRWSSTFPETFNAARLRCSWKAVEAAESVFKWEGIDAQLAWAKKAKLAVHAGPLIDLRDDALPDWLALWRGDFESILGLAVDYVRAALARYKGKVPSWTLVHRTGTSDVMGLSEEEQVRLTARLLQVARQVDPSAQYLVGFDRPWSEWMVSGRYQLGPLHLADYLARSDLGLSGVELEIAPGYSNPGSLYRDLFDFSKLLDLYALVNLPLAINFAFPSAIGPDAKSAKGVKLETLDWPKPPTEAEQSRIASQWISLAVAKPFVRTVTWMQGPEDHPHLYPHSGLIRPDGKPKPLLTWLGSFRREFLS